MRVKSESEVAQLCLTLSDPMDCSLPGSSVYGIFQARVLEWGAIAFSVLITYLSSYEIDPCLLIYHHFYGLEQRFYFAHDFVGQEFGKDLSGCLGSDAPGVIQGCWGYRIHFQDWVFICIGELWGSSFLLSLHMVFILQNVSMSLSFYARWSQGSWTLSWLLRPCVPRDKEWKVLSLWNWLGVTSAVSYWLRHCTTHPELREGDIHYISWWKGVNEFEAIFMYQTFNLLQNDLAWDLFQISVNWESLDT